MSDFEECQNDPLYFDYKEVHGQQDSNIIITALPDLSPYSAEEIWNVLSDEQRLYLVKRMLQRQRQFLEKCLDNNKDTLADHLKQQDQGSTQQEIMDSMPVWSATEPPRCLNRHPDGSLCCEPFGHPGLHRDGHHGLMWGIQ